jgi:hypothetical protein
MNMKKALENRVRGWLPKEPSLSSSQKTKVAEMKIRGMTEWERKSFKISSITNAIMLIIFLGTHLLIDPYNRSIEVSIISWSIFVPSVTLVNLFLYRHYKKQKHPDVE